MLPGLIAGERELVRPRVGDRAPGGAGASNMSCFDVVKGELPGTPIMRCWCWCWCRLYAPSCSTCGRHAACHARAGSPGWCRMHLQPLSTGAPAMSFSYVWVTPCAAGADGSSTRREPRDAGAGAAHGALSPGAAASSSVLPLP